MHLANTATSYRHLLNPVKQLTGGKTERIPELSAGVPVNNNDSQRNSDITIGGKR